GSFDYSGVHLW
nr:Chain C, GLY-SER-PHE-ASP-TYR-SER-GLY-VAL-HIS-LEU-TRP [synthetic construct]